MYERIFEDDVKRECSALLRKLRTMVPTGSFMTTKEEERLQSQTLEVSSLSLETLRHNSEES